MPPAYLYIHPLFSFSITVIVIVQPYRIGVKDRPYQLHKLEGIDLLAL